MTTKKRDNYEITRKRSIAERWATVTAMGVIAGTFCWWVSPITDSLFRPFVDRIEEVGLAVAAMTIAVAFFLLILIIGFRSFRRMFRIRNSLCFPPLWMSVAIGIGVAILFNKVHPVSDALGSLEGDIIAAFVAAIVLTGFLACLRFVAVSLGRIKSDANQCLASDPSPSRSFTNLGELLEWSRDDREITEPSRDQFQHDVVARRIVRRLVDATRVENPTIASVGPLGSGKTSIGTLVKYHLRNNENCAFVSISLWPFETSESVIRNTISAIIKELSQHVGTLSLRSVTHEYLSAVARIPGWWGALASMFHSPKKPKAILQQVSDVLLAIDLQIILWIDDQERFAGTTMMLDPNAVEREADRLGSIRALLYLLDRSPRLSVIIADTSLESRIDIAKIARFVERPPALTPQRIWPIISELRKSCLSGYPRVIIDPANKKLRERIAPVDEELTRIRQMFNFESEPEPLEAMALLLDTPRALKTAIRIIDDTWTHLAGEIDFDDILAMSTIRASRPAFFAFLNKYIDVLRSGFRQHHKNDATSQHPVLKLYQEHLDSEPREIAQALDVLVQFVFPAMRHKNGGYTNVDEEYIVRPQGLSQRRHVDYWSRYLSLPIVSEADSDQVALVEIRAWKDKSPSNLITMLLDEEKSRWAESFVGQFSGNELCRLLVVVAIEESRSERDYFDIHKHEGGVLSVWRMMLICKPESNQLKDSLSDIISEIVSVNLNLLRHIYNFFIRHPEDNVHQLLDDEARAALSETVQSAMVSHFIPGNGRGLLAALQGASPYTLHHLICWTESEPNQTNAEWKTLARRQSKRATSTPP